MAAPDAPILAIRNLSVGYETADGVVHAVQDVSLEIRAGEAYGLIGESGSGKSTIAFAVMRHLGGGEITAGSIHLDGLDMVRATPRQLAAMRGNRVAMVYQDAFAALNPTMRLGDQVAEAVRRHRGDSRRAALAEARRLFAQVHLPDPDVLARRYPGQISGGQQQRVVIAMALACQPDLLIMDEPTTGLDVTTEAVILELIATLRRGSRIAVLFISHNIAVVSQVCERIGVLYAGRMVEEGAISEVLERPAHPYTRGLLDCLPQPGAALSSMPGTLPDPRQTPAGCVFAPRCGFAQEICRATAPPLRALAVGREHLCHFDLALPPARAKGAALPRSPSSGAPLLDVVEARKWFGLRRGLLFGRGRVVRAVDDLSLRIGTGETLAVVGESGSGKSTLARLLLGLTPADGGAITFAGERLHPRVTRRNRAAQRRLQIIFQSPDSALNPLQTVATAIGRPLVQQGLGGPALRERVLALLAAVKLSERHADRTPRQLSGGEKQRVCIARAFAAEPLLVVCDEPTSALDISVQAAILNELRALQRRHGTAYLFISHDLAVVRHVADRIAVMYRGRLVETGPTEAVFAPPHHPYTEALIRAIPRVGQAAHPAPLPVREEPGKDLSSGRGCIYQARCARHIGPICDATAPPRRVLPDGRMIACHIPPEQLARLQENGSDAAGVVPAPTPAVVPIPHVVGS